MLTRLADLQQLRDVEDRNFRKHNSAMSGRNPYKEAKLGVLQGSVADMLLVNGSLYRTSTC